MKRKKMVKDDLTGKMVPAKVFKPIPAKYLKRAKTIAQTYSIVIRPANSGFVGCSLEMPGVLSEGKTPAECATNEYRSLEFTVATMLEYKITPPKPGENLFQGKGTRKK